MDIIDGWIILNLSASHLEYDLTILESAWAIFLINLI